VEAKTKADKFVVSEMRPLLKPDESIVACAHGTQQMSLGASMVGDFLAVATSHSAFLVLTNQRLVLITTRIGAFGPLFENKGVVALTRAQTKGVALSAGFRIELSNGKMLTYNLSSSTHLSSQRDFVAKAESLVGRSTAARSAGRSNKIFAVVVGVVAIALGIAYAVGAVH
jgi:hypothetical protein